MVFTGNIDAVEAASRPAVESAKQEEMLAGYATIKNSHEVLNELF